MYISLSSGLVDHRRKVISKLHTKLELVSAYIYSHILKLRREYKKYTLRILYKISVT